MILPSLVATIRKARPELLVDHALRDIGEAIPLEAPKRFFDKDIEYIEDIGEPTNPCFFTSSSIDPTNWYVLPLLSLFGYFYGSEESCRSTFNTVNNNTNFRFIYFEYFILF